MFRLLTIEREYGSGAAKIASKLADRLGWTLWDQRLTEEIARMAHVDASAVRRCDERMDSRIYRLARAFWRGSYERHTSIGGQVFDTDCMMEMMQEITSRIAEEGNAVVVGRGAPFFLRERADAFHVFFYAPRVEKIRRLREQGTSESEAEEMVDTVDRERMAYIKHYFDADWPTRSLYHLMVNTAVGDDPVIETVLNTMHLVAGRPVATGYDPTKTAATR